MTTRIFSHDEIAAAISDYCDHHGVEVQDVDVTERYDGFAVVGFRLSLDVDGRSRGCDETFGEWK